MVSNPPHPPSSDKLAWCCSQISMAALVPGVKLFCQVMAVSPTIVPSWSWWELHAGCQRRLTLRQPKYICQLDSRTCIPALTQKQSWQKDDKEAGSKWQERGTLPLSHLCVFFCFVFFLPRREREGHRQRGGKEGGGGGRKRGGRREIERGGGGGGNNTD